MKVLSRLSLLLLLTATGGRSAAVESHELEREVRDESGSGSGGLQAEAPTRALGHINLCFVCDDSCNGVSNANAFFMGLLQKVNDMYGDSGIPIDFIFAGPTVRVNSVNFGNWQSIPTSQRYGYLNNQYWQPLFTDSFKTNCGAAFLVTNHPAMTAGGIASFASMCSGYSYGILKMKGADAMAVHLAHELGHLLGIFHDDVAVSQDFLRTQYDPYNGDLKKYCNGDYGCEDQACVMIPTLETSSASSVVDFSKCSLAYYKFWAIFPGYDHSCVQGSTGF